MLTLNSLLFTSSIPKQCLHWIQVYITSYLDVSILLLDYILLLHIIQAAWFFIFFVFLIVTFLLFIFQVLLIFLFFPFFLFFIFFNLYNPQTKKLSSWDRDSDQSKHFFSFAFARSVFLESELYPFINRSCFWNWTFCFRRCFIFLSCFTLQLLKL